MRKSLCSVFVLVALSGCGAEEREDLASDDSQEANQFGLFSGGATQALPPFTIGNVGCPAAHCGNRNGDDTNLPALSKDARILKSVTRFGGSIFGLGCSSNGANVACTYGPVDGTGPGETNLVVYDANGNVTWTAPRYLDGQLNGLAFTSAPLIDTTGQVIAADSSRIVRFSKFGVVKWNTAFPSPGMPISPVRMDDGTLFLARLGGTILAFEPTQGKLVAELALKLNVTDTLGFDTINTPATRGNRAYVVAQYNGVDPNHPDVPLARLFALDVDAQNVDETKRLRVAWFYNFRADSGASPTVVEDRIYFDGMGIAGGPEAPTTFGLRDLGGTYEELFAEKILPVKAQASFAPDGRGGLWTYGLGDKDLVRFDDLHGLVVQRIDVSDLLQQSRVYGPTSALTMSGSKTNPVLMLAAKPTATTSGNVVAPIFTMGIDVTTEQKTFVVESGQSQLDTPPGQFPMAKDSQGNLRMFFNTLIKGPVVVGLPSP